MERIPYIVWQVHRRASGMDRSQARLPCLRHADKLVRGCAPEPPLSPMLNSHQNRAISVHIYITVNLHKFTIFISLFTLLSKFSQLHSILSNSESLFYIPLSSSSCPSPLSTSWPAAHSTVCAKVYTFPKYCIVKYPYSDLGVSHKTIYLLSHKHAIYAWELSRWPIHKNQWVQVSIISLLQCRLIWKVSYHTIIHIGNNYNRLYNSVISIIESTQCLVLSLINIMIWDTCPIGWSDTCHPQIH